VVWEGRGREASPYPDWRSKRKEIEKMSEETLKLPNASYPELVKVLRAYAHLNDKATLTELAKIVGMHKTVVSPNNPFLAQVGLVAGGRDKKPTPLGTTLGRALDHNREDDIAAAWQEVVKGNEVLAKAITTVRIKGGMSVDDLVAHLVYVSGETNTSRSRTGGRTVVDILVKAGVLAETDGKLTVATPIITDTGATSLKKLSESKATEPAPVPAVEQRELSAKPKGQPTVTTPTIAINIQLQIPETENSLVYENLFKALRTHLLDGNQ